MVETVRTIQKKYGSRAMSVAICVAFACILLGQKPFGKGLVLGSLFSVINLVLMGEMLPMRLAGTRKKAAVRQMGSIGFRYMLLAVPLLIAVKTDTIGFAGVAAGLFMVQFVILEDHIKRHFLPKKNQA